MHLGRWIVIGTSGSHFQRRINMITVKFNTMDATIKFEEDNLSLSYGMMNFFNPVINRVLVSLDLFLTD